MSRLSEKMAAARLRPIAPASRPQESLVKQAQETFGAEAVKVVYEMPSPGEEQPHDCRPEAAQDHALWERLLQMAWEEDHVFAWTLCGFRDFGTRIVRGPKGYVLRPEISGVQGDGWHNQAAYEKERDRWLIPKLELLVNLLRRLSQ
jgi:hypothetical protein